MEQPKSATETKTKTVQIDRALVFHLEYLAKQLDLSSPNEVLKFFMRPIIETTLKCHARKLKVETLRSGTEPSICFIFEVQEKWIVGSIEDYERKLRKFMKASGQE
jgi:hypothetical protein